MGAASVSVDVGYGVSAAGSRLATTLALSLGVHAAAALWLDLPVVSAGPPAAAVSLRLLPSAAAGSADQARATMPQPVLDDVPRPVPAVRAAPPLSVEEDAGLEPAPHTVETAARSESFAAPPRDAAAAPVVRRSERAAAARRAAPAATPVAAVRPTTPTTRAPARAAPRKAVPRRPPPIPTEAARAAPPQRAAVPAPQAREPSAGPSAPASRRASPAAGSARAALERSALASVPALERPPVPAAGNRPPRYPGLARRRGQQGRVLLRVQVAADGSTSAPELVESSGVAILDRAAHRAVARWRFTPAERDGRPVNATVDVPVVFRLDGRG